MAASIHRGHWQARSRSAAQFLFVGRDMGLVSMNRLLATVPDRARLAVMPDARRSDDRCVNESASSHDDAVLIELPDDLLEQRTVEIILDERLAKANEGGALRRRLACGETAETSKTGTVIERVPLSFTSERLYQTESNIALNKATGGQIA